MARVGGRNTALAWIVGVICAVAVIALAALALPLAPVALGWVNGITGQSSPQASAPPSAAPSASEDAGAPTECDRLYPSSLWMSLRTAAGAALTPSQDAPVTTATALVDALQPQVILSCSWHADAGSISTTVATVPPDAASLAAAALPAAGFSCEDVSDRIRCTRTDGDLVETIEIGDGVWTSTSEDGWHPAGYASQVATRVFAN